MPLQCSNDKSGSSALLFKIMCLDLSFGGDFQWIYDPSFPNLDPKRFQLFLAEIGVGGGWVVWAGDFHQLQHVARFINVSPPSSESLKMLTSIICESSWWQVLFRLPWLSWNLSRYRVLGGKAAVLIQRGWIRLSIWSGLKKSPSILVWLGKTCTSGEKQRS